MANEVRQYHTVRPLGLTRIPRAFISLATISQPDRRYSENNDFAELVLKSYSVGYYERKIKGFSCMEEITDNEAQNGDSAASFIQRYASESEAIWIICNGVSKAFTLIGLWKFVEDRTFRIRNREGDTDNGRNENRRKDGYIAIGGKTEIIICKYNKCTLTFVSTTNYADTSVSDIMELYGDEIDAINCRQGEHSELYPDIIDIQRCQAKWFSEMLMNWKANDCGVWKTTSSQLSHSLYRRKFLAEPLTTTRNERLDRLERASVFGGRSEVYYCGDVARFENHIAPYVYEYNRASNTMFTERIYRVDISSMYPYIFANYEIPGVCIHHSETSDLSILDNCCNSTLIPLAAVSIETNEPEFPVRIHARKIEKSVLVNDRFRTKIDYIQSSIDYPVGKFDTVLIGPELEYAYSKGYVKALHEIAIYTKSSEYMDYMQYLINKRMEMKISKQKHGERFWKLLANSFGGKLAQRNAKWIDAPIDTDVKSQWGEWYVCNVDTNELIKYRAIAGIPQVWQSDSYSPKGRPAVWSMVCGIGRFIMMNIRKIIPPEYLLQQDTDGMYITEKAIPYLENAAMLGIDFPGKLRIVSEHGHIRFWGPRHYIVDGQFIMSGLSTGFIHVIGDDYYDTKEGGICSGKIDKTPTSIASNRRRVSLKYTLNNKKFTEDGYFRPTHMSPQAGWKPFRLDPMGLLFRGI